MGLSVLSWNINGLTSAKFEDADLINLLNKYDIIFLYESWLNKHHQFVLNGFTEHSFCRKFQNKKANRCSGGIIVYIKDNIKEGVSLVRNRYDTIIWLKLNKRYFDMCNDIFIAGAYMWVENSPASNIVNVDLFDILQNDINDFSEHGSVFLCGDFNARVGNKCDYIVNDRLIQDLDEIDYHPDVSLYRGTQDMYINAHGRKLLELCKSTNVRIVNGRLYGDRGIGAYTFCNTLGSSVIDYFITTENNLNCICDFTIEKFNEWSDHAPVIFGIDICKRKQDVNEAQHQTYKLSKWNNENREKFRRAIIGKLPEFNKITEAIDVNDRSTIHYAVDNFSSLLVSAAEPFFTKSFRTPNLYNLKQVKQAEWFDNECFIAKKKYVESRNIFNAFHSVQNRIKMCEDKNSYKNLIKKKRNQHKYINGKKIENMRFSSPREFWKLFKKERNNASNKIKLEQFLTIFQNYMNAILTYFMKMRNHFVNKQILMKTIVYMKS